MTQWFSQLNRFNFIKMIILSVIIFLSIFSGNLPEKSDVEMRFHYPIISENGAIVPIGFTIENKSLAKNDYVQSVRFNIPDNPIPSAAEIMLYPVVSRVFTFQSRFKIKQPSYVHIKEQIVKLQKALPGCYISY